MRGSPLIRALVVFALLLFLAPVIWQLTHAEAGQSVVAPPVVPLAAEHEISMELAFTTVPTRVSILHLGKQVWTKENPESSEDISVKLSWPKEGGELQFK